MTIEGYERIIKWKNQLKEVLDDMLDAVENKEQLGYFDALIDIETHANLIRFARHRYIDNLDRTEDKHDISTHDILEQFRGGYSTKDEERIIKLLANLGDQNAR